ncbi:hypothetical protein VIGAN_07107100, partial [Vigna angularis var. angularis]
MVSMSAPVRRAALTAFSSLRAAEVGAFLRSTTGSQSCDRGPTPDMVQRFGLVCLKELFFFFCLRWVLRSLGFYLKK